MGNSKGGSVAFLLYIKLNMYLCKSTQIGGKDGKVKLTYSSTIQQKPLEEVGGPLINNVAFFTIFSYFFLNTHGNIISTWLLK